MQEGAIKWPFNWNACVPYLCNYRNQTTGYPVVLLCSCFWSRHAVVADITTMQRPYANAGIPVPNKLTTASLLNLIDAIITDVLDNSPFSWKEQIFTDSHTNPLVFIYLMVVLNSMFTSTYLTQLVTKYQVTFVIYSILYGSTDFASMFIFNTVFRFINFVICSDPKIRVQRRN